MKYQELLTHFKLIPKNEIHTTIFSVAGYPHYENVCSNILAFYLNPNNNHKLGRLFFSALLESAGHTELIDEEFQVDREVCTDKQGRIDILIETNKSVIGIENKIYHTLNNDLSDYSATIEKIAKIKNLNPIKIILSLRNETPSHGFINVTYARLISEIKNKLGRYATIASQKWLFYAIDFLDSIENLTGTTMNMEISPMDKFFIENNDTISQLIEERNAFLLKINSNVNELLKIVQKPKICTGQWIYMKSCLVHDFIIDGHKIAFDLYITPKGWELQLFGRNIKSQQYVSDLFATNKMPNHNIKLTESRYIIEEFSLSTNLETIKTKLHYWFDTLEKTIESNKVSDS